VDRFLGVATSAQHFRTTRMGKTVLGRDGITKTTV
jgi:hypothetical protein